MYKRPLRCVISSFVHSAASFYIKVTDLLRTVMAAAASSSIKGPLLVFTLLCLVCRSSSLTDKQKLEQLREKYQKIKEIVDRLKADYEGSAGSTSELLTKYVTSVDPIIALTKKTVNSSPDEFPPIDIYMESIKDYVVKAIAHVDMMNMELGESIKETEKKLGQLKKCIQFYEEQQAEL